MKKVLIISLLFLCACATPETTSTTVQDTTTTTVQDTTTTTVAETTTTTSTITVPLSQTESYALNNTLDQLVSTETWNLFDADPPKSIYPEDLRRIEVLQTKLLEIYPKVQITSIYDEQTYLYHEKYCAEYGIAECSLPYISDEHSYITTTTTVAGVVSPFLDDEKIRLFPASDLPQSTVDLTLQYTNEAYDLWMADDYYGKSQAKAIYIMITGSDMEAGKNANREYCNHLTSTGFPSADWCRLDTYKDYVNNGGGGINSSAVDGFYFMVMAPQDNEIGNWYKAMTYHEVFHIYQMSNIFTTEYDAVDEYMGKRSGDNGEDVAWWSEGNADFFSALYTYDLEGFKNEMRWALEGGPWPVDRKTQFFQDGIKLYNISWNSGQGVDLGYRIGSWFTAYLVHNHGEESVYTLWNTVNEKGFDQTFIDVYGKDHRTYINEFETWLQQPNDELLKILDGIYSSKVKNQN